MYEFPVTWMLIFPDPDLNTSSSFSTLSNAIGGTVLVCMAGGTVANALLNSTN